MKNQPFSRFHALMALAVALVQKSGGAFGTAIQSLGGYSSRGKGGGHKAGSKHGRANTCNPPGRYPEQSQRQALRKHRRAQGGPGLLTGPTPGPVFWPERMTTDPYTERAAKVFGVPSNDVTPAQRSYAKTMMYVEIYGRR